MEFVMDAHRLSVLNVSSLGWKNLWTYAWFLYTNFLLQLSVFLKDFFSIVEKQMERFVYDSMLVRQKSKTLKPKEKFVQKTKKNKTF